MTVGTLLDRVSDELAGEEHDAFAAYVRLISMPDLEDKGDVAELRRVIGVLKLSPDTVRKHAVAVQRAAELARKSERAPALRDDLTERMGKLSAAREWRKAQLEEIDAKVRAMESDFNTARNELNAAEEAAMERERIVKELPYLFDPNSPTPHTAWGRRQLESEIARLEQRIVAMGNDDARFSISCEVRYLKGLLAAPAVEA